MAILYLLYYVKWIVFGISVVLYRFSRGKCQDGSKKVFDYLKKTLIWSEILAILIEG